MDLAIARELWKMFAPQMEVVSWDGWLQSRCLHSYCINNDLQTPRAALWKLLGECRSGDRKGIWLMLLGSKLFLFQVCPSPFQRLTLLLITGLMSADYVHGITFLPTLQSWYIHTKWVLQNWRCSWFSAVCLKIYTTEENVPWEVSCHNGPRSRFSKSLFHFPIKRVINLYYWIYWRE